MLQLVSPNFVKNKLERVLQMAKVDSTGYVFLDTNTFLQYNDFYSIDWPTVLGYKEVCLVVAYVVLTELDKLKTNLSQRKQSRAKLAIKKFEEISLGSPQTSIKYDIPHRQGVKLWFWSETPDLTKYPGLETYINDDVLIASILEFKNKQSEIPDQDILLVTEDIGLKLKGNSKGLRIFTLPDKFKLSDEPTKEQQELAKLTREVQTIKEREPKLEFHFVEGNNIAQELQIIDLEMIGEVNSARIDEICRREADAVFFDPNPVKLQSSATLAGISDFLKSSAELAIDDYSQKGLEEYEKKRKNHLTKFRKYLENLVNWERLNSRSRRINFLIKNLGNIPAHSLKISIILPPELKLVATFAEFLHKPKRPSRPKLPERGLFRFNISDGVPIFPSQYNQNSNKPSSKTVDFMVNQKLNTVQWELDKLLHQLSQPLDSLIITFPELEGIQEYIIDYKIYTEEISKPVEGQLIILVTAKLVSNFDWITSILV